MIPVLVSWDRDQLASRTDEVLDVYAEAMAVSRMAARGRRSVIGAHLDRSGLLTVAATQGDRLVGIAYGYQGAPGQWWHDHVRAAMGPRQSGTWLRDAFEVCELHVRPALHGTGLGRTLLAELLAATPAATAVLTTPDLETRARAFYRAGGWVDLVRDLQFPGDPRSFAVLGLPLRAEQ
jgi:ribosomal protein S18 acetylase RimI-like enzyme